MYLRDFVKSKLRPREQGTCYVRGYHTDSDDRHIPEGADEFGVNYGARLRSKYVGSYHDRHIQVFKAMAPNATSFSWNRHYGVDWVVRVKPCNASSGMYCAMIAVALGYDDVRLCNLPMDGWYYDNYASQAMLIGDEFKEKITSYSGWTREFFGSPHGFKPMEDADGGKGID